MSESNWRRLTAAALFSLIFSGLVVAVTVSMALRQREPATALLFWPFNGEARASLAGKMVLSGDPAAASVAKRAVQEAPGDAVSLRALGMSEEALGNRESAKKLMFLATKASRRDFLTNLWFIEFYAAVDDIDGAVRYYDYALRTSPEAERLLFPVLTPAMKNPQIAQSVAEKLAARPPWFRSFLQYAFSSGAIDTELVPIAIKLARDTHGLPLELQKQYVQRLAERANFVGLSTFSRGLGHPLINGPASLSQIGNLPPVDWHLRADASLSTYPNETGGFSFVSSDRNIILASRILNLVPGTYSLTYDFDLSPIGSSMIGLSLTCSDNNTNIFATIEGSAGIFSIPPDCHYQSLFLSLKGDEFTEEQELSGTIANIRLKRR